MNDEQYELLKNKLKENKDIIFLKEVFESQDNFAVQLVGGAVVDILEDRKPKDFDVFFDSNANNIYTTLKTHNFVFVSDSKYATTFKIDNSENKFVLQILKTSKIDFEFKISQSCFYFSNYLLSLDMKSFENKKLIPINYENGNQLLDSLSRIPHWKRKGYSIDDITYNSMIDAIRENGTNDKRSFTKLQS